MIGNLPSGKGEFGGRQQAVVNFRRQLQVIFQGALLRGRQTAEANRDQGIAHEPVGFNAFMTDDALAEMATVDALQSFVHLGNELIQLLGWMLLQYYFEAPKARQKLFASGLQISSLDSRHKRSFVNLDGKIRGRMLCFPREIERLNPNLQVVRGEETPSLAGKAIFTVWQNALPYPMGMDAENRLQPERNPWRDRIAVILLMALVFSIGGSIWWYRFTSTPEYSLAELGRAVRDKNYGRASQFVDEERLAQAISRSLTDVLVAKYTKKFQDDPWPFTETRIEWLNKMAPKFQDWSLIGARNGLRMLLSGNGILTGTSGFSQLDAHNFSGLHVLRSEVHGDMADVFIGGLPQPNPFGLNEIRLKMVRVPERRIWRIEEIPDATPIFSKYFRVPQPAGQ